MFLKNKIEPYIFISPFYILFLIFTLFPVFFSIFISFTNWRGSSKWKFVGMKNYNNLIIDDTFHLALFNNFWFSIASIFLVIPLSLMIAVILNFRWLKLKTIWRTIYFLPVATSTVVISLVFLALYDHRYGTINWLIMLFGFDKIDWLGDPLYVKPAIIGLIAWRWIGLIMIYFLAGLQNIPKEIYEAGLVDGANSIQSFFHITLPLLRPILLFVTVIVTADSFRIFDEPFIMNRFSTGLSGGPEDSGLSLALYLYRIGFDYRQLGYGSTIGLVIFFISFFIVLLQLKKFRLFDED